MVIGTADPTVEIMVNKEWDDEDNKENKRPETVIVELWRKLKDGTDEPIYIGYETITQDVNGDWSMKFTNLPKADSSGNEYEYSIKERKVPGYISDEVSGNANEGFTLTNRLEADISGKRPGMMATTKTVYDRNQ